MCSTAGLAVATLHACYGNEMKKFIVGITELTPDAVQVLRAANQLEKDLMQIAVEDSVDSDDGGKAVIREMPPYEAEGAIANLVKIWIKTRIDRLKDWVDRNLQQELWSPQANQEGYARSSVEVLRIINETLDAFFQLPIPMHPTLLPDVMHGLDRCLQYYVAKSKSGCGSRNTFIPKMVMTGCGLRDGEPVVVPEEMVIVTNPASICRWEIFRYIVVEIGGTKLVQEVKVSFLDPVMFFSNSAMAFVTETWTAGDAAEGVVAHCNPIVTFRKAVGGSDPVLWILAVARCLNILP
ncbi:hypothetical protein KIW84_013307 [Lathyrus oleraceus]|uniref:MHD1 domain-containing protein n=1 Tax=Pisum sativum TaxID=3888 RepID=A0A9D5BJY0_PEA|nr:hypothetical protein KIW84_013307 [Pisum sativum]